MEGSSLARLTSRRLAAAAGREGALNLDMELAATRSVPESFPFYATPKMSRVRWSLQIDRTIGMFSKEVRLVAWL